MAVRLLQNNFSGGIISPRLFARSDLQVYYKAAADAENMLVTKEGTIRKRHGIKANIVSTLGECRLFPYKFDRKLGGYLAISIVGDKLKASLLSQDGATLASGVEIGESAGVDLDAIQVKQIADELWICGTATFGKVIVSDFDTEPSIRYEAWAKAEKPAPISEITAAGYSSEGSRWDPSSGRKISYAAYVIRDGVMSERRNVDKIWSMSWNAGYYILVSLTITEGEKFDYIILTKKIGGSYGEVARWYPEDIDGSSIEFRDENITPGNSVYSQTDTLGEDFKSPLCVDCFQQRIVFANAENGDSKLPMGLWFSEVGNINNFYSTRPSTDADAFFQNLSSLGPSFIRWLVGYQEVLVVFTEAGIFTIGFSQTSGFGASSSRIVRISNISISDKIAPIVTEAGIVFVGADDKTVYTASYDLNENALKPINRTVLVEHLTRTNKIVSMAFQEFPQNIVWFALEDGSFMSFTFERNEDVFAWTRGSIPGAKVLEIVACGAAKDTPDKTTHSDVLFKVQNAAGQIFLGTFDGEFIDTVGTTTTPVVSKLTTMRPESQERSVAGFTKNVKDVILRVIDSDKVAVRSTATGAPEVLVSPKKLSGGDVNFSGDVKVMPRGYINSDGQMEFISDEGRFEALQIINLVEISS